MKKMICKSESCLSCINLVSSQEDDEGVEIVCALELDGYEEADDLDPCETCPKYKSDEALEERDVEVKEEDEGMLSKKHEATNAKGAKLVDKESSVEIKSKYVFVGDSLVESKRGTIELSGNVASAWNAKVASLKLEVKREVERLEGDLETRISSARNFLNDSPESIVFVDDLFGAEDDEIDEDDEDSLRDDEVSFFESETGE